MSQNRMKWVIAGVLLACTYAQVSWAQISQMRLFSPYPDDQFGGGAYMREGLFGSIGAGMINITLPPTQSIGFTKWNQPFSYTNNVTGETVDANLTRPLYLTNAFSGVYTMSYMGTQITTAPMESEFTPATEFEVGRQIGHHGWSVKAQILTPVSYQTAGIDASVEIYDPRTILASDFLNEYFPDASANFYYYDGSGSGSFQLVQGGGNARIGHLWGIYDIMGNSTSDSEYTYTDQDTTSGSGSSDDEDSSSSVYVLAPIPIVFDMYSLETKVNYWSVEAMYNYRFHPFRRGTLELTAGLRYTVFDDTTDFFGHATTRTDNTYDSSRISILTSSDSISTGGEAIGTEDEEYEENEQENTSFSGTDLGYSMWNFEAQNHIVGPQVGGRYIMSNNRWRLIGEGKFFAGWNRQNISGEGAFGLKAESSQEGNLSGSSSNTESESSDSGTGGLPTKSPLGTVANHFDYSNHYDEFMPGAEVKLEAAWYWTEAVSFKVGYQFTFLGDIARSTATNEFMVNDDGTFFRAKENEDERNFDTLVHGIMFTAQINK